LKHCNPGDHALNAGIYLHSHMQVRKCPVMLWKLTIERGLKSGAWSCSVELNVILL
jgi:hypothetical protein